MNADSAPHVMVIAGDKSISTLLAEQLRDADFNVTARVHPERDLAAVATLNPALVILDYQWASSDNGWSLLQLLRLSPTTKQIPILLCTGAVTEARQLSGQLHRHRIHVLLKPYSQTRLLSEVTRLQREFAPALPA